MSMSPEDRARIEQLEQRLSALERVENVSFVEMLQRRGVGSINIQAGADATDTTVAVRDATDTTSETVANEYAGVITIIDAQGNVYRIGYY